jgi:hypothetical protein
MMLATLPIGPEQSSLPGLLGFTLDWDPPAWPNGRDTVTPSVICRDQLCFGPDQQALAPQPQSARQLPLIPDPPLWEDRPPARPKIKRRPRRPSSDLSPGQMSLF